MVYGGWIMGYELWIMVDGLNPQPITHLLIIHNSFTVLKRKMLWNFFGMTSHSNCAGSNADSYIE